MSKMPVIENRKAYYDYYVEDVIECGISLKGNEVKSICNGRVSLKESWVDIQNAELFIKQMHVNAWETSNKFDVSEDRDRKLLAHKSEILGIAKKMQMQGYTLIPLKMYFKNGKVKVLVGICKGKHMYDKRRCERDKQVKLDIAREFAS